jgi:hypothetical protein
MPHQRDYKSGAHPNPLTLGGFVQGEEQQENAGQPKGYGDPLGEDKTQVNEDSQSKDAG